MKISLYKAILGSYDHHPKEIDYHNCNTFHKYIFTDNDPHLKNWHHINVDTNDPIMENRKYKMKPWDFIDSDYSIYLDGHIDPGPSFYSYVKKIIALKVPFAAQLHRQRGTVANELVRCLDARKLSSSEVYNLVNSNFNFSLPAIECGFIIRDHNSELARNHGKLWFEMFTTICKRDQLLVNAAAKQVSMPIHRIQNDFNDTNHFKLRIHKNARVKNIKTRISIASRVLRYGSMLK
jgi:hypothetical protein